MCSSMKSRIRSRSVSTWGLGLKSTAGGPLLGAGCRNASSAAAVAGEELAVLLEQPGELERNERRQRALDDPGRLPSGQLRGDGEEEVIDQAGRLQLAVKAGASLAEQRADSALVAQVAQRLDQVDPPLVPDDRQ